MIDNAKTNHIMKHTDVLDLECIELALEVTRGDDQEFLIWSLCLLMRRATKEDEPTCFDLKRKYGELDLTHENRVRIARRCASIAEGRREPQLINLGRMAAAFLAWASERGR
jgi:hypothetical protein